MKDQDNEKMLNEYLKDIKKSLAYQTFSEDEKSRWDVVVMWTLLRIKGKPEQKMAAIDAAYFAFLEGLGDDRYAKRLI